MAQHHKDPLGYGNPEEDMDDLTAQLEQALHTYKPGANDMDDDFDLGDNSVLQPGHEHGLDRYRAMHEESPSPEHLGPGASAAEPSPLEHPSLTYGQLVNRSAHEEDEQYATTTNQQTGSLSQPAYSAAGQPGDATNGTSSANQQGGGAAAARTGSGAGPSAVRVPHASKSAPMVFTVTDPVKRELAGFLGLKAGHVTYLITTRLRPGAEGFTRGTTFTVRRRFRDFVALADVLKQRYRGYFLPPRPEKNAVEGQRMTDTFVEERRAALERYLNRLAQHPVASRSEELRTFVELEAELEGSPVWHSLVPPPKAGLVEGTAKFSKQLLGLEQSVLDPVQAAQPTKKAADPMRALRETAQAMTSSSAGSNTILPTGEAELRRERELMEAKRDTLVVATRQAERLVHRLDRISSVYGDMGLAFFKLAKSEESEGPHLAQFTGTVRQSHTMSTVTKQQATSMVRAARLVRRNVGKSAHELSTLHDHLAAMQPAIKGLTTREKQLLTTDTLQADLDARNKQIRELEEAASKVLGGDPAKGRKAEDLKADVSKLQCSISAAKAEYERIVAINKQELVRLHGEYQQDVVRMVEGFAAAQALSAQRLAEVWLQLANELCANPAQLAQARALVMEGQQVYSEAAQQLPSSYPAAAQQDELLGAAGGIADADPPLMAMQADTGVLPATASNGGWASLQPAGAAPPAGASGPSAFDNPFD